MDYKNCPTARYHEMKVVSSPYPEGKIFSPQQIERCTKCGERKTYIIRPDGQMENSRQYFLDHIRVFAQPIEQDPAMLEVFLFCNPGAAKRLKEAELSGKKHEWFREEQREKFRWALKKMFAGEYEAVLREDEAKKKKSSLS